LHKSSRRDMVRYKVPIESRLTLPFTLRYCRHHQSNGSWPERLCICQTPPRHRPFCSHRCRVTWVSPAGPPLRTVPHLDIWQATGVHASTPGVATVTACRACAPHAPASWAGRPTLMLGQADLASPLAREAPSAVQAADP
jgi:hypothetical protein